MGTNFNVGSFNAINTDIENKPKKNNSKGSNDDFKKKLLVLGGVILGGAIILFLVLFLISTFFPKSYSYDEIENIMKNAAVNYFEDHPKKLPASLNQMVEIDVETLAASEYMKEMIEYTGEELFCSGKVSVQTNGDDYLYVPHLECGDDYITQSLKEVVLKNVTTTGYGLYQDGDNYVYRGEDVNNYLQLEKSLWRIVKVNSKGQMLLILNDRTNEALPWDDRYNAQIGYNIGINTYSASRIKDSLNEYYKTNDEDKAILSDEDRSKLVSFDLCTAKRASTDGTKNNSIECSETLADQKIGLLTASDYMMGSIDSNCKTVVDFSCQNYNYLTTDYKWWLLTATADSTKEAYGVDNSGVAKKVTTSSFMYARPVVLLDSNVLFKGGKGTLNKPYKIK